MTRFLATPEGRLAVITVAVFALMTLLAGDRFLSPANLTSMAFQFPEFAILALAMTVAMLTGGIDLSVVGAANLSAVIAATLMAGLAGDGAGVAAVAAGILAALAVGLALRPLQRRAGGAVRPAADPRHGGHPGWSSPASRWSSRAAPRCWACRPRRPGWATAGSSACPCRSSSSRCWPPGCPGC